MNHFNPETSKTYSKAIPITKLVTFLMDSLTCILLASEVPNTDLLSEIPAYLTNHSILSNEYGTLLRGRCGNMVVSVKEDRVKLQVSLPKLSRGHSLWNMGISDVQDSIVTASDMLHLPIDRALVKKVDFAWNLEMDCTPEVYMKYLGRNSRYARLENPHSLSYNLPSRNLCFYNKIREMKADHNPIPREYEGSNILRYEKKYLKQVAKHFKKDALPVRMLYDPSFYNTIRENWYNDYLNIRKVRKPMVDFEAVKTKTQLYATGTLALIEKVGGVQKMLQDIDEGRKRRRLSGKQVHDLKKAITSVGESKRITTESYLIKELDIKMAAAVFSY